MSSSKSAGKARAATRASSPKLRTISDQNRTSVRGGGVSEHSRLTIGKLAKAADLSTDTLRFYEGEGLLMPARKTEAGYRLYSGDAVRRLDFIKHAQQCGMTLSEIRQLLEMRADDRACCRDVRGLAVQKKLQLERKIRSMQAMSQALSELIDICTAEDRPSVECPILAALETSIARQESRVSPRHRRSS